MTSLLDIPGDAHNIMRVAGALDAQTRRITSGEVARSAGLAVGPTSRILSAMLALGYTTVQEDASDRRRRVYAITPEGRDKFQDEMAKLTPEAAR